jgi:DNA-binding ferritin-like protein
LVNFLQKYGTMRIDSVKAEDSFCLIYSHIPNLVQQFIKLAENLIALGQAYAAVTKDYSKLTTQQKIQLSQHKDSFLRVRDDMQATVDDFNKIAAMLNDTLPVKH